MTESAIALLLAVQSALVGALVFVVKWLVKRSDEQSRKAEGHIESLILSLKEAVLSFKAFEQEENITHKALVETQSDIVRTQRAIIEILERIERKLEAR